MTAKTNKKEEGSKANLIELLTYQPSAKLDRFILVNSSFLLVWNGLAYLKVSVAKVQKALLNLPLNEKV